MTGRLLGGAAALIGTALVLYALLSAPTDEERIAQQLTTLEELLSYDEPPNLLHRTARLNGGFKDLLTERVRVEVGERGFRAQGRTELARLAAGATARLQSFRVRFTSPSISIENASASVTLDVDVEAEAGTELRHDSREANLVFVNVDGDWLLDTAVVSQPED